MSTSSSSSVVASSVVASSSSPSPRRPTPSCLRSRRWSRRRQPAATSASAATRSSTPCLHASHLRSSRPHSALSVQAHHARRQERLHAVAATRSRCAGCAGTCRPVCTGRARSRTRHAAPRGPTRASWGYTRRRRCVVHRARPFGGSALPARPARGGSTTTTSGGPACSTSSSSDWPTLPAKKRALATPFASAFSIAQATDSSRSPPPTPTPRRRRARARRCRCRSRGRRRFPRRSGGSVARGVQRLRHLRVRLEKRVLADTEAQPENLLLDPPHPTAHAWGGS